MSNDLKQSLEEMKAQQEAELLLQFQRLNDIINHFTSSSEKLQVSSERSEVTLLHLEGCKKALQLAQQKLYRIEELLVVRGQHEFYSQLNVNDSSEYNTYPLTGFTIPSQATYSNNYNHYPPQQHPRAYQPLVEENKVHHPTARS